MHKLDRLAGTIRYWRTRVLAYRRTRVSNGRPKAMTLLVKKVKSVGLGFRNFANCRFRLLLHCASDGRLPRPPESEAAAPAQLRRTE